jgi:hypothetical protein
VQPCVSTWDDRGSCYIYIYNYFGSILGRSSAEVWPGTSPDESGSRNTDYIYIYINRRELYKSGDQL